LRYEAKYIAEFKVSTKHMSSTMDVCCNSEKH
jgi:hypothetical protein